MDIGMSRLAPPPPWMIELMKPGTAPKPRRSRSPKHHTNGLLAKAPQPEAALPDPAIIARAIAYLEKCEPAVSGQGGHNTTFATARAITWGFDLDPDVAFDLLWEYYNPKCQPPWTERELRHKVADANEKDFDQERGYLRDEPMEEIRIEMPEPTPAPPPPPPPEKNAPDPKWPAAPAAEAFYGLPGRIVRTIAPSTEADNVALLGQTLVAYGNAVGRHAYFRVNATKHHPNEFLLLIGKTSKSRKGTSWDQVASIFATADPIWATNNVISGLSSGEGLIFAVRDPGTKPKRGKKGGMPELEHDPGVLDKRLLVYETEFSRVLRQVNRDENTLADMLRQAWDGHTLRTLVKVNPITATRPHISLVGHSTLFELGRLVTELSMANGMLNRFIPLCVKRSKILPFGGSPDPASLENLRDELTKAIAFGSRDVEMTVDDSAREIWCAHYETLSDDRPGLTGAVLGRSEAHTRRLAMLYALMDQQDRIGAPHLNAALALWSYAERSARYIFGSRTGDSLADELMRLLDASPNGLSRTDISAYCGRNQSSGRIDLALGILLKAGLAYHTAQKSGGRPTERWFAGAPGGVNS
jgi:hypothetical protein